MECYRHTQPGTVLRWALLLGLLPLPLVAWLAPALPLLPLLAALAAVTAVSAVLLWSLTVEVNAAHFKFWFGPGLIRKTVPLARIQSWEKIGGIRAWGIHWAGKKGWLYNVSGFEAVALTLDNGQRFMVGTDEPDLLCEAVAKAKAAFAVGDKGTY